MYILLLYTIFIRTLVVCCFFLFCILPHTKMWNYLFNVNDHILSQIKFGTFYALSIRQPVVINAVLYNFHSIHYYWLHMYVYMHRVINFMVSKENVNETHIKYFFPWYFIFIVKFERWHYVWNTTSFKWPSREVLQALILLR